MRTIKFRAWDSENKRMVEPLISLSYTQVQSSQDILFNDCLKTYGNILMQFTGLLDKNGREIYEGDILKNPNKIPYWAIRWADENARYWMWYLQDNNGLYLDSRKAKTMEVIGNIYENPELLT